MNVVCSDCSLVLFCPDQDIDQAGVLEKSQDTQGGRDLTASSLSIATIEMNSKGLS